MPTPVLKENSYSAAVAKLERAALGLNTKTYSVILTDPNGPAIDVDQDDGDFFWRVPAAINGWNLFDAELAVKLPSNNGNPSYQLRRNRAGTVVNMLSTVVSVDAGEYDSKDATAAVVDTSNDDVATGDQIYFKCTVSGQGALGAVIEMTFIEV